MKNIKLIAFDLDGTLLNSKKELTQKTQKILECAASMGIEIVPATGRFWNVIPECVRNLDFINYAITLNGAEVIKVGEKNISLENFNISPEHALKMAHVFDDIENIIYDCVINGQGYMRNDFYKKIPDFMVGEWQVRIVADFRTPVERENFYELIKNSNGVQKMQIFTLDKKLRENLLNALPIVFNKIYFTSSIPNNIEISDKKADKGTALKFLAEYLNIPIESTLAFGDGLNDAGLIKTAGIGTAMGNAALEIREIADEITLDCDHDGVAEGIKKQLGMRD